MTSRAARQPRDAAIFVKRRTAVVSISTIRPPDEAARLVDRSEVLALAHVEFYLRHKIQFTASTASCPPPGPAQHPLPQAKAVPTACAASPPLDEDVRKIRPGYGGI